jgi:ElaB/YqjD/DUF883 family membrane-anchored ribosome-binding protein
MFNLTEVFFIVVIVSGIVGYISYCYAEFKIIARMLDELSDDELARLTKEIEQMGDVVAVVSKGDAAKSKTLIQEVISGQTFLYDEHDNFVAQGSSAAEAAEIFFNSRHSASVAIVKCSDGNSYRIINGKIES